jgi:beta-ureidopropionase / N-carbamoyl-L-amino-acid hydrolase
VIPSIDGDALWRDLGELNRCGEGERPGTNRIAFSPADLAGRAYLEGRLRELGMAVRRDAAGNTVARLEGTEPGLPALALGSHTDTVPEGGRYDGALGVVAAIACVRALRTAGIAPRHPLEVIDFAAEEATMSGGTFGSRAMVGMLEPASVDGPAWDGTPVRAHLEGAGIDPDRIAGARRGPGELAAYLELHIEQGGVLDAAGVPLAIVDGIVGIRRYGIVVEGTANHAGTTPMAARDDALLKALPIVAGVRDVAVVEGVVATVGALSVHPGSSNVIPGRVEMAAEARSLDPSRLDAAEAALAGRVEAAGGRMTRISNKAPVLSAPPVLAALEAALDELGEPWRRMPSGAGRDAMCMAAITEVAMLFVPSRGGVSHSPHEHTHREHCELGARALLAGVLELDRRS